MLCPSDQGWYEPGLFSGHISSYFNDTGCREITMPTIFGREVIGAAGVMGFLGCAGA